MKKKNNDSSDRRRFISKLARLGAAGGIATLLLGRLSERMLPSVQAADMVIDAVNTGAGTTQLNSSTGSGPAFKGYSTATSGNTEGVFGESDSTSGIGVWGYAYATSGYNFGVRGESGSTSGIGVYGHALAASGYTTGVYGVSHATLGTGVEGYAAATSGSAKGVFGRSESPNGFGVEGLVTEAGGIGVHGLAWDPGAKPIVAQGASGQTASLQEWQDNAGSPLSAINKDGWMGIGLASPARSIHLLGSQACFRMDRNVDSSAFILVRTSSDFSTVWKTFYVGVDASGVNDGEFFIGDVGTSVSGPSAVRLVIDNNGNIVPPSDNTGNIGIDGRRWALIRGVNVQSGDFTFENEFRLTEEGENGVALYNKKNVKIAIFDHDGNLHIKGKVIQDL